MIYQRNDNWLFPLLALIIALLILLPANALSAWDDVTAFVTFNKTRPLYNYVAKTNYFDGSLTNTSGESFQTPIRLVIDSVTSPLVTVHNADGVTDDDKPYFDFSAHLGDEKLGPGETSSARQVEFYNPNRLRFNFTWKILVEAEAPQPENHPPTAVPGGPYSGVAGQVISFDGSGSTDQDNDPLTFEWSFGDGTTATGATPTHSYAAAGTYTVTLIVTDPEGANNTAQTQAAITDINHPPSLTPIAEQAVDEGQMLTFQVTGTDPDGDDLTYSANNLPEGALFDPLTKTFSWTPTYDQSGLYTTTFTVTDTGNLSDFTDVSITVKNINRAPLLDPVSDRSIAETKPLTFRVTGSDPDGDDLDYSASNLPADAAFDAASRTFSWTPASGYAGTYQVGFTVFDGFLTNSISVRIFVTHFDINNSPSLTPVADQEISEGQMLTFQVTGSDPNGDPLTFDVNGLPSGAAFESTADPNVFNFSWTPGYDQAGDYTVNFTASDPGGLSDTINVDIIVNNVNRPPSLDPVSDRSIAETKPLTFQLTGSDPDGDELTYSANNLSEGALFDPVAQDFEWTPTDEQAGTYEVSFSVSDGDLTDSIDVHITVLDFDVNSSPSLTLVADQEIDEGETLTFQVTASDPNGDDLTFNVNGPPSGAAFESTANPNIYSFSWTPGFDQADLYMVNFIVSDPDELSDTMDVNITVNNVNRPPSLDPVSDQSVDENTELIFQLNGSDPDQDPLTFGASDLPEGATLVPETEAFSWIPTFDQAGSYEVTFFVSDGELSAEQQVLIEVIDVNRAPSIITDTIPDGQVDQIYKAQIVAQDPDGDSLDYSIAQTTAPATIDGATGQFSWDKPSISDIGDYSLTVQVDDGRGGTDSRQYTLSVPDTIPPAIVLNAPKQGNPGETFSAEASVSDNDTVVAVEVYGDRTNFSPPYQSTITRQKEITLPSELGTVTVHAAAWDPSGNKGEAIASVEVVATFDTTPPQITLNSPPQVTPAQVILLTASVSDDVGVSTVTFSADGTDIGTTPAQHPSIEYQIPTDAVIDSTIQFKATAVDFSGNSAIDEASSTVVGSGEEDATPPAPELQAPETVTEDDPIPITVATPNEECLAQIDVYVNHTLAATYFAPDPGNFDVPMPDGIEGGMNVLVEVVVTDCSGNRTTTSDWINIEEPDKGVVAGEVYNDSTGLPIEGADVTFLSEDASTVSAITDTRGQYNFVAKAGAGRVTITKDGFTVVERTGIAVPEAGGVEAFDSRLTSLGDANPAISAVLGAKMNTAFSVITAGFVPALEGMGINPSSAESADIGLDIPAGALTDNQALTLTQVSPQGLHGLLPGGWSPVGVIDISPHAISFQAPANLTVPNPLGFEAGAGIILATWDETEHAWQVVSSADVSADGTSISAEVTFTGQFAFLIPDVLPQPPPDAVAGELLGGITPALIPDPATTTISPEPKIIFYKPGVHSDVGVSVSAGSEQLSSGVPVLVNIAEEYNFYSGERIVSAPYVQDIILYSLNRPDLTAAFPVTPSYTFEALTLNHGVINVDVMAATDTERSIKVITPEGGTVALSTGEAVTLPEGGASDIVPVDLEALTEDSLGIELPPDLSFVGGAFVSFSGNEFDEPLGLSVPVPAGFDEEQGQLLLVQLLEVQEATRMVIVGVGSVQDSNIVALYSLPGSDDISFGGMLSEGGYIFVQIQTGIGFASGTVFDAAGVPLDGAIVSANDMPVIAISAMDSSYAVSVNTGAFSVTALDPEKMDSGTATGTITQDGELVQLDLFLIQEPPHVVSFSPVDGQENVPLETAVKVTFSEPLDAQTVISENLILTGPEGPVAGTLTLASSNTQVTFRPTEALKTDTTYTFSASQGIQDLAGYALESAFVLSFTSLDTTPPPPPPAGNITATIPDDEGRTTITTTQGTAGPHDTVSVINKTQGISTPALVEANGSFTVNIHANIIDEVVISITDQAGNETVVPIEQFQNPDGSTVIGPEGGFLEAENGVILNVPPGAFPSGAVVRLTALSEAEIGVSAGPDFPFVAGFEIECSVEPETYLNASAPLPEGIGPDAYGIVAQVVEVFGEPALSIVDTAKVIDGRLTTSSPPCPGIQEKIGRYAKFLNQDQRMAMGVALLNILTQMTREVVYRPLFAGFGAKIQFVYPDTIAWLTRQTAFSHYAIESVCLPVPPDQPLIIVIRDANTRELIDIIDIDPISPGEHADIIIQDHNDTEGPKIVDVIPTHRKLDLLNRRIKVRFSEPISWGSAKTITLIEVGGKEMVYNWGDPTKVEIVDHEGAIYEGTWSLSENNSLLEFETDRPLPMGRAFKLNLNEVRDLAGNSFDGPQIRFATFEPYVVLPSMCAEGLTKNKIQNDLGCNENQLPLDGLWFIDVDFSTKTPDESYDGKWHTDIVAIQGGIRGGVRWGGEYSIFTIDASDPTDLRVTAAYETDARYRLHRVRLLDDLHVLPRESEYADPQFWKNRLLYYREDDPSIRICADPGSEELDAWMDRYCSSAPDDPDPPVCKAITDGCGDLVITTLSDTQYSYLWIYDITDRNKPEPDPQTPSDPVDIPITDIPIKWFSSRMLSDNGVGFGFFRHEEAPAGLGTPFGLDIVTTPNAVVPQVGDPVAAYVANYGIGIELVDLSANIPIINEIERDSVEEILGLNAHLYYKDVSYIPGRIVDGDQIPSKVVAIAGDISGNTGVRTLEIFHSDLSGEPVSTVVLPSAPDRIATVTDFPVFGADSEEPELHDIAFVTGQGRISVVDIPADAGAYPAKTSIEIPSGVRTKHIQVDRNAKVAYIAATNDDEQIRCDYLLVVDVSQPFTIIGDNNNDGWDDRVIGKIRITIPGYVGPVYLQGFRLDTKKGLIYAGLYAGGDQGLAIIKVWECPDVGVDFKSAPGKIPVPPEIEKKALKQVIRQGLEQAQSNCGIDPNTITIIEQGSGSCVWTDNGCGKNYQPGISDHDFEVFFDDNVDVGIKQCVIRSLYNQVMTIQSDPIPIEVDGTGYKVYFEDISFYYMNREDFEEAQVNLDRPDPEVTRGDVLGDMGLGRQLLLLKWLMDGDYVEVPGFDLEGEDFNNILANLKKPMDVDGDGENDEPSHISRLEGYEWARLQEAMIYGSGALIRIHGASEPGTTLHKTFKKDLHKVAKAAIRSALARIIANEEGNEMAVNFELDCPVCVDASYSYDPYAWRTVACESFAHYIASLAARMVRDYPDEALFTPEEVSDKIYRFYEIKSGLDTIETEQEAVEFIAEAVNFINEVIAETLPVYAQTISIDPRAAQRVDNMEFVKGKIQEYTSNGKKHIVPRFYNKGILSIDEKLWVRMYRETQEVENRNISIDPGSYVHLDTRKEPPPDNDDPDVLMTERKNVPVFSLEVPQTDPGQNGWCSFFVDIPDNNNEGDRENNWAKLFYYVLDPSNPTVPDLPPEPELTDILGSAEEDYLESATFCTCQRQEPPVNVVQSVNGISDSDSIVSVYTAPEGTKECFTIEVLVENQSHKDITNVKVFGKYGGKSIESDEPVALISAGGSVPVFLEYCNENAPDEILGTIWIVYDYEESDATGTRTVSSGQVANTLNLVYVCPIAIVPYDPNPNPEISEVMYGGSLYRYYKVVDQSAVVSPELYGVPVKATIDDGTDPLKEKIFYTDELGRITHKEEGEIKEGVYIKWEDISEMPLDSSFPINVKLEVLETCAEPLKFEISAKRLEFEESLNTGASLSVEAGFVGVDGVLGGGANLRLGLKGEKEGDDLTGQSYNPLVFRGSSTENLGAGYGPSVGRLNLRTPYLTTKVGASAGVKGMVGLTTGSQYEFKIDDIEGHLGTIATAALLLQTFAENGETDPVMSFVLNNVKKVADLGEFIETSKTSSFWDVTMQIEAAASAEARITGGTVQAPGKIRDVSTDYALINTGAGASAKLNTQYGSESFMAGGDKSSLRFSGELQAEAGFQSSIDKGTASNAIMDFLDKERNDLLSFGQISGGVEFSITVDENNSWFPIKLDMTFEGEKNYGFQQNLVSQDTLQNLGAGSQLNVTYTVTGFDGIIEGLKNVSEFKGILEKSIRENLGDRISAGSEIDISIGPSLAYESFLNALMHVLSVDGIEYTVQKKNGDGKEIPFELGVKILGTGFKFGLTFKGDYSVDYLEEKGTIKDAKKYVLEKYKGSEFAEPSSGKLESWLVSACIEVARWLEENNYFTEIERIVGADGMVILRSLLSSELRLINQSDIDTVYGPLSFQFEEISGPVNPSYYAPTDIIGPADRPHYGLGGFHTFFPSEHDLAEPASLILNYHENKVLSEYEDSIAIYRWEEEIRDWVFVDGNLNTENNTVTTEITRLGTYTLAPAMPARKISWANQQTQLVGENIVLTLTSELLTMNNGDQVSNGTMFHVISAIPFGINGTGLFPFGTILTIDSLPEVEGIQVPASDGTIQIQIEYPADIAAEARIIIFSEMGSAFGDDLISLITP